MGYFAKNPSTRHKNGQSKYSKWLDAFPTVNEHNEHAFNISVCSTCWKPFCFKDFLTVRIIFSNESPSYKENIMHLLRVSDSHAIYAISSYNHCLSAHACVVRFPLMGFNVASGHASSFGDV